MQLDKTGYTPIAPSYLPALRAISNTPDAFFATPNYIQTVLKTTQGVRSFPMNADLLSAQQVAIAAQGSVLNGASTPSAALEKAARDLANQTGRKIAEK